MKKNPLELMFLRIVAGSMRSRRIEFHCDPKTRPMKDRTREALMSLLGGTFPNAVVFDLFAGSGILAFEVLSRGASKALVFEILKSAIVDIKANAKRLEVSDRLDTFQTDIFAWSETLSERLSKFIADVETPWVVFCNPPYAMWDDRGEELKSMMSKWWELAPLRSLFAIELEASTPIDFLPTNAEWDVRLYRPAKMAVAEKL